MTVNERLHALGLADAYARANRDRDEGEIRRLLRRARVDEPSIELAVRRLGGAGAG
jgi:hypothetical protein